MSKLIKETYLVTIERERTVTPEEIQQDIYDTLENKAVFNFTLISIVNRDDVFRGRK